MPEESYSLAFPFRAEICHLGTEVFETIHKRVTLNIYLHPFLLPPSHTSVVLHSYFTTAVTCSSSLQI